MDIETLQYLLSPDGERLLCEAASSEGTLLARVTHLRRKYPAHLASAALELLDLRKRAAAKFSRADRMFFTREAMEQSSSEIISHYRAERFDRDSTVLDLACGIGGDTIGLAERCHVTAVDMDPVRVMMARRNLEVYGLAHRVEFVCADVTTIPLDADGAFLDPSRRTVRGRTTHLSQMTPSEDFIRRLIDTVGNCGIKLSPATDDSELESLGGEIEFISSSGECKESVVWTGKFRTAGRRATVLPARASLTDQSVVSVPLGQPGRYLYEPDPCVIRSHLIGEITPELRAWKLDEMIAYLSSDDLVVTPFADAYEIIESMPFNLKTINQALRGLDTGSVIVKKRGVAFEPDEIRKRLKLSGSKEYILVLTRVGDKPFALICTPARSEGFRTIGVERIDSQSTP